MKDRRTWIILGILAAGLWLLFHPSSRGTLEPPEASSRPDSSTVVDEAETGNPRRHRQTAGSKTQDQHLTRHDANQLKDFILPHIEGKEISLREALALLHEAYLDACYRSQEKPLALKLLVKDEPDHPISFSLHGRSFLTSLNHLAALAGLTVDHDGTSFALLRSSTAEKPANSFIRFGPDAKGELRALGGSSSGEIKDEWESLLRAAGLVLEPGTKVVSTDHGFQINGTQAEVTRVQSGINLAGEPPVQIKVVTKLVSTTSPVDIPRAFLTDAELQFLMRDLAQQPGTQLTAYPSATAKEGDPLTIEVIRETTRNGQPDWAGMRGTYQTERTGLKITAYDQSESREESRNAGWLKETDSAIYSGDTHLQLLNARNGVYQYRLLTVTATDASGHPLGNARSEPAAE